MENPKKKQRNRQQIRLLVDRDRPEVCQALAITNMAWRKARLRHPMSKPFAVFKDKKGEICYVTQSKVTDVIRIAVKRLTQICQKGTREIPMSFNQSLGMCDTG